MTRLSEDDVRDLALCVRQLDRDLHEVTGSGLRSLARAAAGREESRDTLAGARIAAVPLTSGQGAISGFAQAVRDVLRHLGCNAWVPERPDVPGIDEAVRAGAEVLFLADDDRFIALHLASGRAVGNDECTADGYALALEMAAGPLRERDVLLLGLGPIGKAAARRLLLGGALVHVVEPDGERLRDALDDLPGLLPADLSYGLERCELIFDATPAAGIIDACDINALTIAAVPGVPSGFTAAAQAALGPRHIHDPLAIGVAVMAARALA